MHFSISNKHSDIYKVTRNNIKWIFLIIATFNLSSCQNLGDSLSDIFSNIRSSCNALPSTGISVNTTLDNNPFYEFCFTDEDSGCSLRNAVFTASWCSVFLNETHSVILQPSSRYILESGLVPVGDVIIVGQNSTIEKNSITERPLLSLSQKSKLEISDLVFDGAYGVGRGIESRGELSLRNIELRKFNKDSGSAIYVAGNLQAYNLTLRENGGGSAIAIRPSECTFTEREEREDVCLNRDYRIEGLQAFNNDDARIEYDNINTSILIKGTESHHEISNNQITGFFNTGESGIYRNEIIGQIVIEEMAFRDNRNVVFDKTKESRLGSFLQLSKSELSDNDRVIIEAIGSEQYIYFNNSTIANNDRVEYFTRNVGLSWLDFDHMTVANNKCFIWSKYFDGTDPADLTEEDIGMHEHFLEPGDDSIVYNNNSVIEDCPSIGTPFELVRFENNIITNPFDGGLRNNGGHTNTLLPRANSSNVIDQVSAEDCTPVPPNGTSDRGYNATPFDQRSLPRPSSGNIRCDRGAVERQGQ